MNNLISKSIKDAALKDLKSGKPDSSAVKRYKAARTKRDAAITISEELFTLGVEKSPEEVLEMLRKQFDIEM